MLRSLLLFLSERRALRRWMETSPAAAVLTRRFVAGQTLDQEVEVCRRLNSEGILVSLDHLGENVASAAEARASLDVYIEALRRIAGENLQASVSVKLTQFGLDLSEDLCRENVAALLEAARAHGGFVEFDMEAHAYVDRTLRIVTEMHARYGRARAVVQAYLYRTSEDVEALCRAGIPVRLCKGAYREPPDRRVSEEDAGRRELSPAVGDPARSRRRSGTCHARSEDAPARARVRAGETVLPRTGSSSRCCTGSAATCNAVWPETATACVSMFLTAMPGTLT